MDRVEEGYRLPSPMVSNLKYRIITLYLFGDLYRNITAGFLHYFYGDFLIYTNFFSFETGENRSNSIIYFASSTMIFTNGNKHTS